MLRLRVAVAVLAMVAAACGGDAQDEVDFSLTKPGARATVDGNVVDLDMSVSNIEITGADGNRSGRSGHFHVFVDRKPVRPGEVIPVAPDVIHSADDPIRIAGLARGAHTLTVVLGDGTHRRLGGKSVQTRVVVQGPAVTVTAPDHVPQGSPVPLQITADGFTPAPANGDTSGATGHFHIFVDKDPVRPGQPVPTGDPKIIHTASTSPSVPDLGAGDHTLWVVVGDGTHVAFDPAVMAVVKVTVA